MNKTYVLAPLAGLVLFGAIYGSYSRRHEAALLAQQEQAALAQREKFARDQAALAASRAAATAGEVVRQQQRLAREQQEAAQKQVQTEAEQRRAHAFEHERKLRSQVDRRRAEIERATEALALLTRRTEELAEESAFHTGYLKQAETNQESYYRLLEKIDAAERASAAMHAAPAQRGNPGSI